MLEALPALSNVSVEFYSPLFVNVLQKRYSFEGDILRV